MIVFNKKKTPTMFRELTFELVYYYLKSLVDWQIKTELLAEDIRHYRRIISLMRTLISATGQHVYSEQYNQLWRRLEALEVRYQIYD